VKYRSSRWNVASLRHNPTQPNQRSLFFFSCCAMGSTLLWNLQPRRSRQQQQQSPQQLSSKQKKASSHHPLSHNNQRRGGVTKKVSLRSLLLVLLLTFVLLVLVLAGATILWLTPSKSHNNSLGTTTTRSSSSPTKNQPSLVIDHEKLKQEIVSFLKQNNNNNSATTPRTMTSPTSSTMIAHLVSTWTAPLVHIVNTRFMQEQGHLKALGRARLHLFRTFCLPTMIHQSTQDFLWIIKTDPFLDAELLQDLMQDVMPYDNIYLVASNTNFMTLYQAHHHQNPSNSTTRGDDQHLPVVVGNSWRDGAEPLDLLLPTTTIYTGNRIKLYQAMLHKDRQVVLETRLDADDGLHKYYLHQIQEKAIEQFLGQQQPGEEQHPQQQPSSSSSSSSLLAAVQPATTIPKWLYWCTRRHVEWHGGTRPPPKQQQLQGSNSHNNNNTKRTFSMVSSSDKQPDYYGTLMGLQHSKMCITPGITVGFGIGTTTNEIPLHPHDQLFQAIRSLHRDQACGYNKVRHCLELVEDFLFVAIRARTPTSAGMLHIETEGDDAINNNINIHNNNNNNRTNNKSMQEKIIPQESNHRKFLYWDLLHHDFAVLREQVKYTNQYILKHLVAIAKDNLEGQCTSDHSCKVRLFVLFCFCKAAYLFSHFGTQSCGVFLLVAFVLTAAPPLTTLAGRRKGKADEDHPNAQLVSLLVSS
jgi:Putative rhamnosyl transferase